MLMSPGLSVLLFLRYGMQGLDRGQIENEPRTPVPEVGVVVLMQDSWKLRPMHISSCPSWLPHTYSSASCLVSHTGVPTVCSPSSRTSTILAPHQKPGHPLPHLSPC